MILFVFYHTVFKMSTLTFLTELYKRDALYFQRMLEFFLQSRFNAIRLYVKEKRQNHVFFSLDGQLIDCRNNRLRFNTITEWYNTTMGTSFKHTDTSIFNSIHISQRVTIQSVLVQVSTKEVEEFLDIKYRSNQVYGFMLRQLKARKIFNSTEKRQVFTMKWQDRLYTVEHNKVVAEGGYSVVSLLDYVCGSENQLTGLYYVDHKGNELLLTEDLASLVSTMASVPVITEPNKSLADIRSEMDQLSDRRIFEMDALEERLTAVFRSEISPLQIQIQDLQASSKQQQQTIQTLQDLVHHQQQTIQALQTNYAQQAQTQQTLCTLQAQDHQLLLAVCSQQAQMYQAQQEQIQTLQTQVGSHQHYIQSFLQNCQYAPSEFLRSMYV